MAKVRINISLEESSLRKIDKLAHGINMNRSAFISFMAEMISAVEDNKPFGKMIDEVAKKAIKRNLK